MLQDLYPHMYHNEMSWKAPSPDDIALIFEPDHTVYCNLSGETLTLPRMCENPDGREAQYAFSIDETAYYLVSAHPGESFQITGPSEGPVAESVFIGRDESGAVRRRGGRKPVPLV